MVDSIVRWSWTQPICDECFSSREPGREPIRMRLPEEGSPDPEICVDCGRATYSGIWYRVDPEAAAHPTQTKGA